MNYVERVIENNSAAIAHYQLLQLPHQWKEKKTNASNLSRQIMTYLYGSNSHWQVRNLIYNVVKSTIKKSINSVSFTLYFD